MGLTIYKPTGKGRRVHPLLKFAILWAIATFIIVFFWDLGAWLHTGVWNW